MKAKRKSIPLTKSYKRPQGTTHGVSVTMKRKRRRTRTRAAGVGTRRGGQRGRGAAGQLLAAAAGTATKQLMKPLAKKGLQQAAKLSANYAMNRLLRGLYKRKRRAKKAR